MHAEWIEVPPETAAAIARAKAEGRPVVAVGTTAARTLEGAWRATGAVAPFAGTTDIFIRPGYRFAVVDAMLYTYRYRQTYPGFGFFTLGQALWSIGILTLQYRFFGEKFSLVSANLLLLLQPASWYQGLALYGGVANIKKRAWPNYALTLVGAGFLAYYAYVEFDTCKRVLIFSGCSTILYLRMALEPYVVKKWKTYSMQSLFTTITAIVAVAYALRILWTWDRLHCLVGGPDPITKSLLILSMPRRPIGLIRKNSSPCWTKSEPGLARVSTRTRGTAAS